MSLNFAVFSYNISVLSNTGLSPFYLTFGSEARLSPDLIVESTSNISNFVLATTRKRLPLLLKTFATVSRAFAFVRENLYLFYQREKDRYDLGFIERIFQPGDNVRLRLKSRQKGPTKFQSVWSVSHEVLSVIGVVVTLKELLTGREYVTHHDKLSNPLLSGEETESQKIESDANPRGNKKEPKANQSPVNNPEEALMRTRVGRIAKPPRNSNFKYFFLLPSYISASTSKTATSIISHVSKHWSVFSTTNFTPSVNNLSAIVSHSQEDKISF